MIVVLIALLFGVSATVVGIAVTIWMDIVERLFK